MKSILPVFTFNIQEELLTVTIAPIDNASLYEIHSSNKEKGVYEVVSIGVSNIQCFKLDPNRIYYKVRGVIKDGDKTTYTPFSKPQFVDLVEYAKQRDMKIDSFFQSVSDVGSMLNIEDLNIAIESLKLAQLEIKERESRRQAEAEAEALKKTVDLQNKRREAAAKRAATRRQKAFNDKVDSINRMDLPTTYVNEYETNNDVHVESTFDGLMMSLDTLGIVDIEFISAVTGQDLRTVIENLKGSIYQNPLYWNEVFYKGWETADEYLSGNLMHKYKVAKEYNDKYHGYFQNNVTALEGVLEPEIAAGDIYITLGSPWIPTDIIDDFIAYMAFGDDQTTYEAKEYFETCISSDYAVRHDEYTGYWEIPNKGRFRLSQFHGFFENVNYKVYGTQRMDMLTILEHTLNMKTITISDAQDTNSKKRIINHQETVKALEKQKYMIETFQKWIWEDDKRKERIQSAYSRKYGNFKQRRFDGSYLELPGLNKGITLYPYQKNAVARILLSPNTLLAHDVGAGKTYIMIAAGMELRRLKKSKKNLYVVPNNIISQWEMLFKKLYPESNILVVSHKTFSPKKRMNTLNRIKNEDFDAILMTYSCFDMLPLSDKFYVDLYEERKEKLQKAENYFYSKASLEKKIKAINKTLDEIRNSYADNPMLVPFDDLGINTLFVDEAHNYKNIDLESRITQVRGISNTGSSKCNAMLDKVRCIQRHNNGGRVIFATGTPVTNSLSDIFVMQKYLQEGELFFQGINSFDAWAGMFAEKKTDFEIDVDTNNYHLVTRFNRYCNIPELASTLSSIADFHKTDSGDSELPILHGYTDSLRDGSVDFKNYLKDISNRADDIRQKRVDVKDDNMLKVTTDGRKAALDMRLIDLAFGLDVDSKVMRCAENVYDVYSKNIDKKATQLVFCDTSTPKDGFNLYDDLKNLLAAMGMPEDKIAYVHDATSDERKHELFKKMNDGDIALLIGSTAKMGHGMNVQKRLIAIHHLDVPWRPSDMIQREGRIIRRGNSNKEVQIFRYITKASFDAYSWQLLENKQKFISQIMSNKVAFREGGEIDDVVLNYAEVKALAIGNPKIKRYVEVSNELEKYRILQRDFILDKQKQESIIQTIPLKINDQKQRIKNCENDYQYYLKNKRDYNSIPYLEQKAIREQIYNAVKLNQNNPYEVEVLTYQGFKIVVPAYMVPRMPNVKNKAEENGETMNSDDRKPIPYINVVGSNTYYLEIESEAGITVRLNNLLDNLLTQKKKYEDVLLNYENKLNIAREELAKKSDGYMSLIEPLEQEFNKLKTELGLE